MNKANPDGINQGLNDESLKFSYLVNYGTDLIFAVAPPVDFGIRYEHLRQTTNVGQVPTDTQADLTLSRLSLLLGYRIVDNEYFLASLSIFQYHLQKK